MAELSAGDFQQKAFMLGTVFEPTAPIDREGLFAGRKSQIRDVVDAIQSAGSTCREAARGPVLIHDTTSGRTRFHFENPLMQPYVLLRGLAQKLSSSADLTELKGPQQKDLPFS